MDTAEDSEEDKLSSVGDSEEGESSSVGDTEEEETDPRVREEVGLSRHVVPRQLAMRVK